MAIGSGDFHPMVTQTMIEGVDSGFGFFGDDILDF
jgi:hypothetical protein